MTDLLVDIADLPGVTDAVAEARAAVDRLLRHRILRQRSAELSTESALRGARATAALAGVEISLDELRADVAGRSGPRSQDPVVQGALRVSAGLGGLTETWRQAPRQTLARLHVLAVADTVPPEALGRPRTVEADAGRATGQETAPEHEKLGAAPEPAQVASRLDMLSGLLTTPTRAPAMVVSSIVHGELMAIRPFGRGDGLVARAAQRLTLVERGLDPKSLTAPEVGHAELAEEYWTALRGYVSGTPDGVAGWVTHCAEAVRLAARDSLAVCEAYMRG